MKIMILGASHGGMESLHAVQKLYPTAEVEVVEHDDLTRKMGWTPEEKERKLAAQDNVTFMEQTDMVELLPAVHQVKLLDLTTQQTSVADYDKLILAPGAAAVQLPIPGITNHPIMSLRSKADMGAMRQQAQNPDIQNVVVIGAGYIGMSTVEPFVKGGKHVTVIDVNERVLGAYLDEDFTADIEADMTDRGITLALGEGVERIESDPTGQVTAVVSDQASYPADLVILSVGAKPNTQWLTGAVELSDRGIITTDDYQRTSAPDVFAIGDATEIFYTPANQKMNISLAGNARRQARNAVRNLVDINRPLRGVQGTSALPFFDFKLATTGLSGQAATKMGIATAATTVEQPVTSMPNAAMVRLELRYRTDNQQLVGAQVMSTTDQTEIINLLSLAVNQRLTVADLVDEDFFFQPALTMPNSVVTETAEKALLA